jgi:hypothetical protein
MRILNMPFVIPREQSTKFSLRLGLNRAPEVNLSSYAVPFLLSLVKSRGWRHGFVCPKR